MSPVNFCDLQHRARRQERAREWPELRLFALALIAPTAVYDAMLALAEWWFA